MDKDRRSISSYDEKSNSLYIFARAGVEEDVVELVPGVNIELDRNGEIIGIEILKASRFLRQVKKFGESSRKPAQIKEPSRQYRTRRKSK